MKQYESVHKAFGSFNAICFGRGGDLIVHC